MNLWRRMFGPRPTPAPPLDGVHALGVDPLDPHGDGTIGPGDPMWELMTSGKAVIGNRRPDGDWDVQTFDVEEPGERGSE